MPKSKPDVCGLCGGTKNPQDEDLCRNHTRPLPDPDA